jgi:hypothetical protein
MVSFSWVEDADHPSTNYQFTPTAGAIIHGASTTISSSALAATEGINTGSWKGTLGDDNLHWVVAGDNPDGLDVNLTLGGVQLNGANKLIIQTEVDLDATVLGTYVQICDWLSNTSVDSTADSECTGGGWRTLNTRTIGQQPVPLVNTSGVAFQWHIHNGYWGTGTTGGTAIDTPLVNFVNGSDEIKIRYYSASTSATQIAIDYLRVYPIVDPIYQANGFQKESGGTVTGHYGNTFGIGNTSAGAQQAILTGDGLTLGVPGTVATSSNFYITFGNVKTYTGMNTILVNTESLCSAATADIQYKFKIRNFALGAWILPFSIAMLPARSIALQKTTSPLMTTSMAPTKYGWVHTRSPRQQRVSLSTQCISCSAQRIRTRTPARSPWVPAQKDALFLITHRRALTVLK